MMSWPVATCFFSFAGVADKLSQLQHCQAKASSVQEVLQLLVGRPTSSSGGSMSGSKAAGTAAAETEASSTAAAAALGGCLGTVKALVKAIDAAKRDIFAAWQVCEGFS